MYKAFISYNRDDVEFAKKLHRQLEMYVVPKAVELSELQSRQKKPLYPIFRDQDEMVSGGALSQRLKDAIKNSEYLVVVCSRTAARLGVWMDVEIREFLDAHGADRVIAVVIDGEPNAEANGYPAEQECMPPALLSLFSKQDSQPLWVDMRSDKKDRSAFLRLVAGLLSIDSLNELIRRDEQRQRRSRRFAVAALSIFILLVGGLGISVWYQRNLAQEEQIQTALGQARNAILAGQAEEGYQILRSAYDGGLRGDVENALILMASWVPSDDTAIAADEPVLTANGANYSLIHPSGSKVALSAKPEQLIFLSGDKFAIVYSNYELSTFDLEKGSLIDQRKVGLILRSDSPIIVSPTGGIVLGMMTDGGHLNSVRSYLVAVTKDWKIREPVETFPEISLDNDSGVGIIWRAEIPVVQGDCRYVGLVSSAEALDGNVSAESLQSFASFDFYEISGEGLQRISGVPEVDQFFGDVPPGLLPYEPMILPPPPGAEESYLPSSLTDLGVICDEGVDRRLSGAALESSIVEVAQNANREPRGWWTVSSDTGDDGWPDSSVTNPCVENECRDIVDFETLADGSRALPWDVYEWSSKPMTASPVALPAQTEYYFGSQTMGQLGHGYAICKVLGQNNANCVSFPGNDMVGPGYSGSKFQRDSSWFFSGTTRYGDGLEPEFGFRLVNLDDGISLDQFENSGLRYAGALTDFSPHGGEFATINSSGLIEVYRFDSGGVRKKFSRRNGFVAPFEISDYVFDSSFSGGADQKPVPVALSWIAEDSIIVLRRDGGIAVVHPSDGRVRWEATILGIGSAETIIVSPDRKIFGVVGHAGARLFDTSTGMPISGIFGYPENTMFLSLQENTVTDSGRAQFGNVTRIARERPTISEAISTLENFFGAR